MKDVLYERRDGLYIQLGAKKNWTLHTKVSNMQRLGPLYAGGVSNSFTIHERDIHMSAYGSTCSST